MNQLIRLQINGQEHQVAAPAHALLLDILRDHLGLTGAKRGCDHGECGACAVLIDGKPVNSCLVPAASVEGREIQTVEGVAADGRLLPLQQAFIDSGAIQCGFCTSGMLLVAKSLLDRTPDPSEPQIRAAIGGNVCRCTGYVKIVDAIRAGALAGAAQD